MEGGGSTLYLVGNRWQQIAYPYVVTSNTVLEFDFQSDAEGEVHGIGLDDNLTPLTNSGYSRFTVPRFGVYGF